MSSCSSDDSRTSRDDGSSCGRARWPTHVPLKDTIATDRFPIVTVALIVANVIVCFFLQDGRLGADLERQLPVMVVLGLWFLEQIAFGAQEFRSASQGSDSVASFAHIGGFAFGLLTIGLFARRVKDVPVARRRQTRAVFR